MVPAVENRCVDQKIERPEPHFHIAVREQPDIDGDCGHPDEDFGWRPGEKQQRLAQ